MGTFRDAPCIGSSPGTLGLVRSASGRLRWLLGCYLLACGLRDREDGSGSPMCVLIVGVFAEGSAWSLTVRVFNPSERKEETDRVWLYKCWDGPAAIGGSHGIGASLSERPHALHREPNLEALSAFCAPSQEHLIDHGLGEQVHLAQVGAWMPSGRIGYELPLKTLAARASLPHCHLTSVSGSPQLKGYARSCTPLTPGCPLGPTEDNLSPKPSATRTVLKPQHVWEAGKTKPHLA